MTKKEVDINGMAKVFYRSDVAKALGVSTLTIANREKRGEYPEPTRDRLNGYRRYSLKDVINLMRITYDKVNYPVLISMLYDKGMRDPKKVGRMIDDVISSMANGANI